MEYYKAYEKRYKQIHSKKMLWSSKQKTNELEKIIKKYKIQTKDKILDLGCGEGRDSINLLNKGYNLLAVDYSVHAIKKCNELTNGRFINNFKQMDLIEDSINLKFKFIYSIAVIHMFLEKKHRNAFYKFIYSCLEEDGYAFVVSMGDGILEYESDMNVAFVNQKRTILTTQKELKIAATSCKIVNWETFIQEINASKLEIVEKWISEDIPEFNKCMCVILKKRL